MKAVSVRQPFAWAIAAGHKPIENRPWNTRHRGQLLLHAGLSRRDARDEALLARVEHLAGTAVEEMYFGGIIGRFRVAGVIPPWHGSPPNPCEADRIQWAYDHIDDVSRRDWWNDAFACSAIKWWIPDQFGWVLTDVVSLPFVPFKGALSFFEVPDALLL